MSQSQSFNQFVSLVDEQHEITPQLVQQIKKDFGNLIQNEPEFIGKMSIYNALYDWVFPIVQQLLKNDRQKFNALIYSIDAGYMKEKFGRREESELVQWTHAILLRECLKVFIRNNYKV